MLRFRQVTINREYKPYTFIVWSPTRSRGYNKSLGSGWSFDTNELKNSFKLELII